MPKKRWGQREKIKAVHDKDLERFLSSLGVLDQIKNGYHRCVICNSIITLENFGAVFPKDDKINFLCDRSLCLAALTRGDKK
jgi:hypothetical protein